MTELVSLQKVSLQKYWRAAMAFGAALVFGVVPAGAISLQEHFNNYGASDVPLDGLSGGSGFGGVWASSGNDPIFVSLATGAGNNLTYGYDNTANEADASGAGADGAAGDNGGTSNDFAVRSVGSLAGTLWISALVRYDSPTADVYLWLDSGDLIGIEDQQAVLDYGSSIDIEGAGADDDDLTGADPLFAINATHLLLLKVVFDAPSTAETYSFWVDPTLDGTESGLGAPLFTRAGINALGGALTNVGVAFNGSGGRLDAILLSNDADGLLDVANVVPEPAASLLVLSGLGWLAARRLGRRTPST